MWFKVKVTRYRPGVAQRVSRGISLLFHDRGTRRGEWSAARLGRTLPPGNTRYPFYRRLGGSQGRSGRAENLVRIGIRSRTVQSVVTRYTDWATRPTYNVIYWRKLRIQHRLRDCCESFMCTVRLIRAKNPTQINVLSKSPDTVKDLRSWCPEPVMSGSAISLSRISGF